MKKRTLLCLAVILSALSCRTEQPAPPAPVVPKAEETPDVIKIAIWFVQFEGIEAELAVGSGRVVSQDKEAYYVGFKRKVPRPHRSVEVVVKVYKKNGWAEWEEY
jgi:hypothetical protein